MFPPQVVAQRDFTAGQLDESAARRDDTPIMRAGLKTARNIRILNTGAACRRPGRRALIATTGIVEEVRPAAGVTWLMILENAQVRFVKRDLSASQTFGSMPWTTSILPDLRWVESDGAVVVAHQSMAPRVFTYNATAGTWASSTFAFAVDPTGAVRQPYYNFFPGQGITLTPSARTGSITITFSAPVLVPAHVGKVFRYAERQMTLTGYTSSTVGTATVIEELPPTYDVVVDTVSGLQVGDVVEGLDTGAKGQVTAIVGTTVTVLLTKVWGGFAGGEKMVGPRSVSEVSTEALNLSLAPATQWDEAAINAVRGWPGAVNKDSQRLIFTKFPTLKGAIAWSATATLFDFKIGATKTDAIFEVAPGNAQVLDVLGGADEFVFTDEGVLYIPVSVSQPLIAGGIEFREISNDASSAIRPQKTGEGLVYVNAGRTRVLAIVGTGQVSRPYVVQDLTEFHAQLIKEPVAIATSSADVKAPERYIYVCNGDGTLAVGRYQQQAGTKGWVGWVPWDGLGPNKWVTALGSDVTVTVEYAPTAGAARWAEVFEDGLLLDGTNSLASAWTPFNWAAGLTVSTEQGGWYRGDFAAPLTSSSGVPVTSVVGLNGGFDFEVEMEPFVPHADPGQSHKQRLRPRRISLAAATVQHSQAIEVGGKLIPFWLAGEDQEEAPPLRDSTYRVRPLGRTIDPTWSVKQVTPGALVVTELTTETTI
jgi:hypothetical protein